MIACSHCGESWLDPYYQHKCTRKDLPTCASCGASMTTKPGWHICSPLRRIIATHDKAVAAAERLAAEHRRAEISNDLPLCRCILTRASHTNESGPSAVATAGGYVPRRLGYVEILGPDMSGDDVGGDP